MGKLSAFWYAISSGYASSAVKWIIMKSLLHIVVITLLPVLIFAQSKKVKLYAFQQQVLPGISRTTIDESGNTKQLPSKIFANYFIYLEGPEAKKIEPRHVWIKGKLYNLKLEKASLPVVIQSYSIPVKKLDTLVRLSSNPVLQLQPLPTSEGFTPSAGVRKKIRSKEIVVHTVENGKNCYYYLNRIKVLDPVALQ